MFTKIHVISLFTRNKLGPKSLKRRYSHQKINSAEQVIKVTS